MYDFINKIQKSLDINLHSKITKSKFYKDILYLACFDKNLYKINLKNLEKTHILRTLSNVTSIEILEDEPLLGLSNGQVFYKDKYFLISKASINALSVKNNQIIMGDSLSNLYIYDTNFKFIKKEKVGNDSLKFFAGKNAILWNSSIYKCLF